MIFGEDNLIFGDRNITMNKPRKSLQKSLACVALPIQKIVLLDGFGLYICHSKKQT